MMHKLDEEIHEIEARIASERSAMALAVDDCVESARNAVVSPQSLLAVAAVGFVLGSMSKRSVVPVTAPAAKQGWAPLLGSVVVSLMRSPYGWTLAQNILHRRRGDRAAAAAPQPARDQ